APPEVLVLGRAGAGKTLLVRRLRREAAGPSAPTSSKGDFNPRTLSTIGVEVDDLERNGRSVRLREVGHPMASMWPAYFAGACGLLYVVDAAEASAASAAQEELRGIMAAPDMRGKPVIVVLNKSDAAGEERLARVCAALGL
ncbi:unnamed protein product, partial [Phaeothamnion confervicola]